MAAFIAGGGTARGWQRKGAGVARAAGFRAGVGKWAGSDAANGTPLDPPASGGRPETRWLWRAPAPLEGRVGEGSCRARRAPRPLHNHTIAPLSGVHPPGAVGASVGDVPAVLNPSLREAVPGRMPSRSRSGVGCEARPATAPKPSVRHYQASGSASGERRSSSHSSSPRTTRAHCLPCPWRRTSFGPGRLPRGRSSLRAQVAPNSTCRRPTHCPRGRCDSPGPALRTPTRIRRQT